MPVTAQAEQDYPGPALLPRRQRFVYCGPDGMRRFRRRQNSLRTSKLQSRLEDGSLRIGFGFDMAQLQQVAQQR